MNKPSEQMFASLREISQSENNNELRQKLIAAFKLEYSDNIEWLDMFGDDQSQVQESFQTKHPEIDGYNILKALGSGASGKVLLAEDENTKHQVAIKVAMQFLSDEQLHRFQHESRLLSRLTHVNIAQLYHSGIISHEGLPYIVMEHIDGLTIHRYCQDKKLNFKQIVELFIQALEAVQYAHNRGIVHRDIKPENILVTHDGLVKLLDFGIALATDNSTQQLTQLTKTGEIVGTLAYMSPEQVSGQDSLDTRADVYSLGVVLYQLLSDSLPHKVDANQIFSAISQIIEDLPIKLSTQNHKVDADLVTIVHHAIEKNPESRYQSPRDFKADLNNWINGDAISVKHNTLWHTLKHITKKNKALVAGSMLAVLGLITGLVFAVSFAFKEQQAREIADFRTLTNIKTVNFITELLTSADPDNIYGDELTVMQVIDNAEASIQGELNQELEVEANIRTTLAGVYVSINQLGKSQAQVDLVEKILPQLVDYSDYIEINFNVKFIQSKIYLANGVMDKNINLLTQLIENLDQKPILKYKSRVALSNAYLTGGNVKDAQETIEIILKTPITESFPKNHQARLFAQNSYALLLDRKGEFKKAKEIYEEIIAIRNELYGEIHVQTLITLNNLATVEQKLGNSEQAQTLLEKVIKGKAEVLGSNHLSTLTSQANLLSTLITSGKLEQADELSKILFVALNDSAGALHPRTLEVRNMRAYMLEDMDQLDEAEILYRSTLKAYHDAGTNKGPELFGLQNNLAMLLMKQSKYSESKAIFDKLLSNVEEFLGKEHIYYAIFMGNYGELLLKLGKFDMAKPFLTQSYNKLLETFGETHQRTLKAKKRLEQLPN